MAKRGIVVVTLSHRLGIFGWFSHPELTAESPQHASGNYGLMDQTRRYAGCARTSRRSAATPRR